MIVGVPKEVKDRENRVSTTPAGVAEYVARGHDVVVESVEVESPTLDDVFAAVTGSHLEGAGAAA